MKNQSFFGGVAVLFLGGVVAKALGAFYKIPLTWILGTEGLGLYQLVFPLFSMLLIVSSTGMPTAISKLVSQQTNSFVQNKILACSLKFMFVLCVVACLFLILLAQFVSGLQNNPSISILYYAITPSIIFVGVISAFRGYFQGKLNMLPTTLSNVCEQVCKIAFGLSFSAILIKKGVLLGAFGAVLGVVIAEFITMILMFILYLADKRKQNKQKIIQTQQIVGSRQIYKSLFKTSMPVVLSSVIIPLSLSIDSVLVVNLLNSIGYSGVQSVCLWGISSGMINTLINLPVAICLCVATAIVPFLSNTQVSLMERQQKVFNSFHIVCLISLPFVVIFSAVSSDILQFLFGNSLANDTLNQFEIATKLLLLSSPLVFLICVLQTQTAILQGQGKLYVPVVFVLFAVLLKTLVLIFAVKSIGIYGVVVASFVLYVVATLLNTLYIRQKLCVKLFDKSIFTVVLSCVSFFVSLLVFKNAFSSLSVFIALPLELLLSGIVFLISYICLNVDFLALILKKLKTKVYNWKIGKRLN